MEMAHSPVNFRHTVLGVIGIFFYVGIEIGIPGVLIFYLASSHRFGSCSRRCSSHLLAPHALRTYDFLGYLQQVSCAHSLSLCQ